ncbi:hypothetical protein [Mesorhizobium sp. dw_380]|uniref:hypothetical protein n=1 Tax=Mesorhizobium sp. dw_380 TaxID=2812001 RepID=UPI001BDDF0EB|nr:hypothetical protein [Mesorhizobium sp. dw_380]
MTAKWLVENLRLSVFSNEAVKGSESDWSRLTGQEEAESRQAVPAGRIYAGEFGPGRLSFSYQASRADIILAQSQSMESDHDLPVFAEFDQATDAFVETVTGWLETAAFPIVRIAFGGVILQRAEDFQHANRLLGDYVRSAKVEDRVKDFLIRTNWPTNSKVNGAELNRITAFSAMRILSGAVSLGAENGMVAMGEPVFAVRLEIDHSTDAANAKQFEKSLLVPIFMELVDLARENVETGECP